MPKLNELTVVEMKAGLAARKFTPAELLDDHKEAKEKAIRLNAFMETKEGEDQ
jgi:hypothetical protein